MYRIALNTSLAHLNKGEWKRNQVPIDDFVKQTDTTDTLMDERSEVLFAQIKNQ